MQVMPTGDFEQKTVMVGQQGTSAAFGVSDDPMLMSMLSTGFYGNPLRTMIQEVMFNAWDAHKMGNCTDKPVDIYMNDSVGLVIRDYGPGISPEDIVPVYCIYGNSTKRDNKGQTGGFGLGSKSPFAYTDSFTVTSHYNGTKTMYMVDRVSDANDGKPGLTQVMASPTEETGLMVSIPLLGKDRSRARDYLRDLLKMSGVTVQLHFEDEEPEIIESTSLPAGEWNVGVKTREGGMINAVYGGVRYEIPERDEYKQEYRFLQEMANRLGEIHLGFPPDSLVPLPNREGLNMNTATMEAIKEQFEIIQETFRVAIKPAAEVVLKVCAEIMSEQGIQPQFIPQYWGKLGSSSAVSLFGKDVVYSRILPYKDQTPEGVGRSLWRSMLSLFAENNDRQWTSGFMSRREWSILKTKALLRTVPELYDQRHRLSEGWLATDRRNYRYLSEEFSNWMRNQTNELMVLENKLGLKKPLVLRLLDGERWRPTTQIRNLRKLKGYQYSSRQLKKAEKQRKEQNPDPIRVADRLWWVNNGEEIDILMMDNHIILSKSAAMLEDLSFDLDKFFAPFDMGGNRSWSRSQFSYWNIANNYQRGPIPALVVTAKHYDEAKEYYQNLGYTIIEAPEPAKKVAATSTLMPSVKVETKREYYPLRTDVWRGVTDENRDIPVELDKVKTFINYTQSMTDTYDSYAKPSDTILSHIKKRWPETVVVWNKNQNGMLEKAGAKPVSERIESKVKILLKNEARIEQMVLFNALISDTNLPSRLLQIQEVQKYFGVPYIRTADKERLADDWNFLRAVRDERFTPLVERELRTKVRVALDTPMHTSKYQNIEKTAHAYDMFNGQHIKLMVRGMKPGEVKMFSQKLLRFLKTV